MADATITEEIWKDIPDYGGRYQASSFGRVRSVDYTRNQLCGSKVFPVTYKGVILKNSFNPKTGYLQIGVSIDGKPQTRNVHCVVAEAFLGPKPPSFDVAHCDGDKANNAASNLRYATRRDNMMDKVAHGTMRNRDNGHSLSILNGQEINKMVELFALGRGSKEVAARFGVSRAYANDIKRKMLPHLTRRVSKQRIIAWDMVDGGGYEFDTITLCARHVGANAPAVGQHIRTNRSLLAGRWKIRRI